MITCFCFNYDIDVSMSIGKARGLMSPKPPKCRTCCVGVPVNLHFDVSMSTGCTLDAAVAAVAAVAGMGNAAAGFESDHAGGQRPGKCWNLRVENETDNKLCKFDVSLSIGRTWPFMKPGELSS